VCLRYGATRIHYWCSSSVFHCWWQWPQVLRCAESVIPKASRTLIPVDARMFRYAYIILCLFVLFSGASMMWRSPWSMEHCRSREANSCSESHKSPSLIRILSHVHSFNILFKIHIHIGFPCDLFSSIFRLKFYMHFIPLLWIKYDRPSHPAQFDHTSIFRDEYKLWRSSSSNIG
jgi:hypothetical protein